MIKNLTFLAIFVVALTILKYVRVLMLQPMVWFAASMITYVICTSGVVYAIIHNVPWFKMERDQFGNIFIAEYFMKGQRGQWAGEGYIFSCLCTGCGFVLIFLSMVDKFFTKKSSRRFAVLGALVAV